MEPITIERWWYVKKRISCWLHLRHRWDEPTWNGGIGMRQQCSRCFKFRRRQDLDMARLCRQLREIESQIRMTRGTIARLK